MTFTNCAVKKVIHKLLITFIIISILSQWNCNKSTNLGSSLLSNEWINAQGLDTFSMSASSFFQDSIIYGSAGFPSTFFIGHAEDPLFGKYDAELYSQLYFGLTKEVPFLYQSIDSVVFSMKYDSSSFFGDPEALHSVYLYPLQDTLDINNTYYKNVKLNYSNVELGSLLNFKPNLADSIKFKIKDVEYNYAPQLRFKLDTGNFMGLLRSFPDTVFNDLSAFYKNFPGVALVSKSNGSLIGLLPGNAESKITIYYTKDSVNSEFVFSYGLARVSTNQIDNTGSKVEGFTTNVVSGDSVGFLQGFGGPDLRIKIPYHSEWAKSLINYAVLEIISPEVLSDNTNYYKRPNLLNIKEIINGRASNIIDASYPLSTNNINNFITLFGGNPVKTSLNGEDVYKYRFNITAYFTQNKIAKKDIDMIVTPLYKVQTPTRLVVGGSKNNKYPAKLILVLSD